MFTAGLSDSDGCWSAWEKRGRTAFHFNITSRSNGLLMGLASALEKWNYHPHVYLSQKKGTIKLVKGREGNRWITLTEDIWTLVISRRDEVKAIGTSDAPLQSSSREDRENETILGRWKRGLERMGPRFTELQRNIRSETNESISRAEIEYKARHREPASGVVG